MVYETLYVPTPAFIEVSYEIKMIADYQQQMNQMISPYISRFSTPAVFTIDHNGHYYETFVDPNFGNESNNAGLSTDERLFKTTANFLGRFQDML